MMLDFDSATTPSNAPAPVQAPLAPTTRRVEVIEDVVVTTLPSEGRAYLASDPSAWSWTDLRDYVVHEIEARFGTWPRDAKREYGIFTRFAKEHGALAGPVAKYAFEQAGGFWSGAPISVNRFCKGSDAFFANVIKDRLAGAAQTAGW